MELTYDHKVALFDRLEPHLEEISKALGRRVLQLPDNSPQERAAADAKQAIDAARVVAGSVADRPDPILQVGFRYFRSWFGGRLVLNIDTSKQATLTLALRRFALAVGVERINAPDPGRLTAELDLVVNDNTLNLEAQVVVWRIAPSIALHIDAS